MLTSPFFYPAVLLSYDQDNRTAMVSIPGLTDGEPSGIHAMLAYPIGDDDLDTERELIPGADVWVFFEQGDTTMPVIAFYRRHGKGRAIVDTRRIRQKNIEILARSNALIQASDLVAINSNRVVINGDEVTINASKLNIVANDISIKGNISHQGDLNTTGSVTAGGDIKGKGISLKDHTHDGVETGRGTTGKPI
ncbi:MAG: phage baseplate assembly protein [Psychrobacter sp.]|nr:phage baseplate assembly protein [Psychrobacter sp.]